MFSFKNLTQRRRIESIVRGASIFAILFILLLTGCSPTGGTSSTVTATVTANLNGEWKDSYGTIVTINTSAKTIKYMVDASHTSYEGQIVNSPDFTAANGVLIIKFTKYYTIEYDWNPPYDMTKYEETPANNGKFGALYWKDLMSNSVYLADAYDSSYNHVMYSTLNEAQTNFTMDKVGNYIDWSYTSPYKK